MNTAKTFALIAVMTALFGVMGFALGGEMGMLLALVFAGGMNLFAFWNSDKLVLRMYGAREVSRQTAPEFYDMVARLAQQADLPMPKVYIIDTPQPNAFATGRNPEHAAVAATTSLMQMLTYEELEGVMAHELAHVKNRDTLTMTVTATIAGAISVLANMAMWSSMLGGNRDRGPGGAIVLLAMAILAPMAAGIVQMAISRSREYEADRIGAEICRNPLALAAALQKIEQRVRGVTMNAAERNPATAHMFIINPLNGQRMDGLFTTHPKTQNRIDRLVEMSREMGPSNSGPQPRADRPSQSTEPTWGGGAAQAPAGWGQKPQKSSPPQKPRRRTSVPTSSSNKS